MNRSFSLVLMAACALAVGAPVAALAQDVTPVQQRVPSSDLNLRGAAGRATLDRRVRDAAERVCDTDGSKDLASVADANRCRQEAMRNGQAQASAMATRQEAAARAERAAAARHAVARAEAGPHRTRHRVVHHRRHARVTHHAKTAPAHAR